MKTHTDFERVKRGMMRTFALLMLAAAASIAVSAQAPPSPVPAPENILSGALIIPMDNVNQGNAAGTTFNLRAYGLANRLLQNDIPVKWAIKPGKGKDATDFAANVSRIAGNQGVAGPANVSFAGGPFIITRDFDTPFVRSLIDSFNTGGSPVTVYKTNADASVDIRYTLTHKPKIAVGPDAGNFGAGVYQQLFTAAGIPEFTTGITDIGNAGACFTLATQGHSEDPTFVSTYKQFVLRGGNLILQCASIGTFENHPNGHFQTLLPGYTLFSSNTVNGVPPTEVNSNAFSFPEGSMPFNQFIGLLADQDGEVTEFADAPGGGPDHNRRVSVTNTGADSNKFVATVSQYNGTNVVGGVVFEFGGHNYARDDDGGETDSEIAKLNGQRMQLNAVFVPPSSVCAGSNTAIRGYKSVRRFNNRVGGPPLIAGDTVEWTIDYINNTPANQFNFQIRDIIGEINGFLIYVPGSVTVTQVSAGSSAFANAGFDGVGDDASSDMLQSGAVLLSGGRIQVKVRTVIDPNAPKPYTLFNQTTARSDLVAASGSTKSDAIDATNTNIFGVDPPPATSVQQVQNGGIIDPTQVMIPAAPTAAEVAIEGNVVTQNGLGIQNALVTVMDAATGETKSIRTNWQGFFRIEGLQAGGLYTVTITHRRYRFPGGPQLLNITDEMTGLTYVGRLSDVKGSSSGDPQ